MATVLVTGGTGEVGKVLVPLLIAKGHDVTILSRTRSGREKVRTYLWDVEKNWIEEGAVENADYIIHLAGAGIADERWTPARKKFVIDSRVDSCKLLFQQIKKGNHQLKAFISSSAIGYYGAITTDQIFKETDPSHTDFLAETCNNWEQAADLFGLLPVRVVKIRCGVVLTEQGGALAKMTAPMHMGFGAALGSGAQYIPWIHVDDLCGMYLKAMDDEGLEGAYNAVSPEHVNNKDFTSVLAKVLHKRIWLPNVPAFVLKLALGEMSALVLNGSRISSDKIINAGYVFQFPRLENALNDILQRAKAVTNRSKRS